MDKILYYDDSYIRIGLKTRMGVMLLITLWLFMGLTGILFAGDPSDLPEGIKDLKIGGLWYLSYQNAESGGIEFNKFTVKRGYINIEKKIAPWLETRITPDTHQDDEGDMKIRLKYAYAKFKVPSEAFIYKPWLEAGIAHMPWLDFEEHINYYRLQDTMFAERNNNFNSADFGLTLGALLGGEMSEEYQKKVNKKYPGRYGSFAVGVYNGGGYHAKEKNENKVLEGRLTLRPVPDQIPGLQFSYFGIYGKGNVTPTDTTEVPEWRFNLAMVSFEHQYLTLTGTYVNATGNQKGEFVDAEGKSFKHDGYSLFCEIKMPGQKSSIIGRWDRYNPRKAVDNDENDRFIIGYAYHLPHHSMLLVDYEQVNYNDALMRSNDWRIQTTIQVHYP